MPITGYPEPSEDGRNARWTTPLVPNDSLTEAERKRRQRNAEATKRLDAGDPRLAVEVGYLTEEDADRDYPMWRDDSWMDMTARVAAGPRAALMPEVNAELSDDGKRLMKRLSDPKVWYSRVMKDVLKYLGEDIVERAQTLDITPRDTGAGINTIGYKVTLKQLEVSAAYYMVVQDQGRKAGSKMPPVKALLPWVTRAVARGRFYDLAGPSPSESRLRSIAFLMARAIKREGIKERRYFGEAARAALDNPAVEDYIIEAVQEHLVNKA